MLNTLWPSLDNCKWKANAFFFWVSCLFFIFLYSYFSGPTESDIKTFLLKILPLMKKKCMQIEVDRLTRETKSSCKCYSLTGRTVKFGTKILQNYWTWRNCSSMTLGDIFVRSKGEWDRSPCKPTIELFLRVYKKIIPARTTWIVYINPGSKQYFA